jgi:hypothetical protein
VVKIVVVTVDKADRLLMLASFATFTSTNSPTIASRRSWKLRFAFAGAGVQVMVVVVFEVLVA